MREEINLRDTLLKNRWGRDQKIKPGDKVRVAPFQSVKTERDAGDQNEFLSLMTEGLTENELYRVKRIGQFPDDGTVILYLDLGQGREEGYYAEYLQAVDERKIKAVEFPLSNPRDVVQYLQTITTKACRVIERVIRADEDIVEETTASNKWIILPAAAGRCKVTMEGEPRELNLNPEKVIVIPVPAGKRHSLMPMSGFSCYTVLCEGSC